MFFVLRSAVLTSSKWGLRRQKHFVLLKRSWFFQGTSFGQLHCKFCYLPLATVMSSSPLRSSFRSRVPPLTMFAAMLAARCLRLRRSAASLTSYIVPAIRNMPTRMDTALKKEFIYLFYVTYSKIHEDTDDIG